MQHSFFSAASSLKPGVLHLCVVFHLNESVPAKVQGYLSMALRIACLLATCLLTRLALPIATLLAAQFHFTDTQNLDSLTTSYNFPRLKSGVKKKDLRLGRNHTQPVMQFDPVLRNSKKTTTASWLCFAHATGGEGFLPHQGAAQHHASGRACLQRPHLTQSGEARNKGVDRSQNAWPHEMKPACTNVPEAPETTKSVTFKTSKPCPAISAIFPVISVIWTVNSVVVFRSLLHGS